MEREARNAPRLFDLLVSSVFLSHALQTATATTLHIGSKHFSDTELTACVTHYYRFEKTGGSCGNDQRHQKDTTISINWPYLNLAYVFLYVLPNIIHIRNPTASGRITELAGELRRILSNVDWRKQVYLFSPVFGFVSVGFTICTTTTPSVLRLWVGRGENFPKKKEETSACQTEEGPLLQ